MDVGVAIDTRRGRLERRQRSCRTGGTARGLVARLTPRGGVLAAEKGLGHARISMGIAAEGEALGGMTLLTRLRQFTAVDIGVAGPTSGAQACQAARDTVTAWVVAHFNGVASSALDLIVSAGQWEPRRAVREAGKRKARLRHVVTGLAR
jgi:hypothetical protein